MWVTGGFWPCARLEGHRGSDAGRPGRAQDGPRRSTESRGRRDVPLEHTLGRGGARREEGETRPDLENRRKGASSQERSSDANAERGHYTGIQSSKTMVSSKPQGL